jgi:hypothetical protein
VSSTSSDVTQYDIRRAIIQERRVREYGCVLVVSPDDRLHIWGNLSKVPSQLKAECTLNHEALKWLLKTLADDPLIPTSAPSSGKR